jgi:hypothetical protein
MDALSQLSYTPEYGAPERSRTSNLTVRSRTLYPVELQAQNDDGALPTELHSLPAAYTAHSGFFREGGNRTRGLRPLCLPAFHAGLKLGVTGGTRTHNSSLHRRVRLPFRHSYHSTRIWCAWGDSNSRPSPSEGVALVHLSYKRETWGDRWDSNPHHRGHNPVL